MKLTDEQIVMILNTAKVVHFKDSDTVVTNSSRIFHALNLAMAEGAKQIAGNPTSAEPVAWLMPEYDGEPCLSFNKYHPDSIPLYTNPASTLSAAELGQIRDALGFGENAADNDLTDAYELEDCEMQNEVINQRTLALNKIRAAIALIEKVKK